VDTDASRLAADNFDLSRVEADADADPEFRDCRIHQCPGADRLCGTVEQREKAVACRCHLSAAQAVDRRSDSLVVLAEDVCPGMVTESFEDLGAKALHALRKTWGPRVPRLLDMVKRRLSFSNASELTPALLEQWIGESSRGLRLSRKAHVRLIAELDADIILSTKREFLC
jgi:hypothetical protein